MDGQLNVAAVSLLTERVLAEGAATLQVAARGTLDSPDLNGTVDLTDVMAAIEEPNVAVQNLNAHIDLTGNRLAVTRLDGSVNGGSLDGSGTLMFGQGTISDLDFRVSVADFAYDAPLDLRSLSDSTILVTSRGHECPCRRPGHD